MRRATRQTAGRRFRAFAYALLLPLVFSAPQASWAADAAHDLSAHHAAAGGAEHDGEHHGSGGLPQLNVTTFPTQIFWLFLVFGVMYFLFSRKSLPAISGVIENRRAHIDSDLDAAQKLKEEAERIQRAYEESLENARQQSTEAFAQVEQSMKDKAAREQKAFQERSSEQLGNAEKSISAAKAAAMEDMNSLAAEIARKAAEKIIGVETDIKQAKDVVKSIHNRKAA